MTQLARKVWARVATVGEQVSMQSIIPEESTPVLGSPL